MRIRTARRLRNGQTDEQIRAQQLDSGTIIIIAGRNEKRLIGVLSSGSQIDESLLSDIIDELIDFNSRGNWEKPATEIAECFEGDAVTDFPERLRQIEIRLHGEQ